MSTQSSEHQNLTKEYEEISKEIEALKTESQNLYSLPHSKLGSAKDEKKRQQLMEKQRKIMDKMTELETR